ncbi:AcrR family transcriptional regulator [Lipingzhangella halophila]|uniref:AcrR family transcriptional regulator n=1 Tax=Lipingzhangella halophila TaxID=1783352 RepID=A0A7W7W4I7_9ACTN|nr:TetR/AcrR family transcriptional regulator [Lipingzhangella halophila]MBB4934197.1 AcrR family transcriptional regulator [Lipingzhangella halophila]
MAESAAETGAAGGQPGGGAGACPAVPDRLLAAATRLFADRGFERTSVQDLVDAAGVTKGAMYHYFASKEDVLFAVFRRVIATQMRNLDACATAEGPVRERLRAAAVDVVESTVQNLDDMVIYFRSLHVLSLDRQDQVRAERRQYQDRFRALIEEGQSQRVFRTDVPADMVASQYFGAVNHLGMWYRPDGELGGAEIGGYYADLLLTGLRPA